MSKECELMGFRQMKEKIEMNLNNSYFCMIGCSLAIGSLTSKTFIYSSLILFFGT
jgi:hypothetical protein